MEKEDDGEYMSATSNDDERSRDQDNRENESLIAESVGDDQEPDRAEEGPVNGPSLTDNKTNHHRLGTRLIIEQMELQDFKSYAGTRVIGPFHKRFSSVVGPNGSGKSNVIDALLFVFGKRASQIRLKKVSELIHNSEHFQNLPSATVTVRFVDIVDSGDDDDYERIPGSELVVSRTAYRNNTSKYFINGQSSTYTEVTTLLMSKGIDLDHNRFLILQGEVEQIAMMKPKSTSPGETGILEYLEDIIGSNTYVEKIQAAQVEVENLQQDLHSKSTRLKLSERERDCLEASKDEAVAFLQEEHRLLRAKANLYQVYVNEATENVQTVNQKADELNAKLQSEVNKHQSTEKALEDNQTKIGQLKNQFASCEAELARFQAEFDHLDRRDVQLRENSKHTSIKLKSLRSKVKKENNKISQFRNVIEECQSTLPELRATIERRQRDLEDADQERKRLFGIVCSKTEGLRQQMESKQKLLIPLRQAINHADQRHSGILAELQIFDSSVSSAESNLQKSSATSKDLESQMNTYTTSVKDISKTIGINVKRNQSIETELGQVMTQLSQIESQLALFRGEYEQGRQKCIQNNNRGSVLAAMSALKSSGAVPGIYGRLGSLGSISLEYDVAVSTACPSLNHIVVDTIETAQKCTSYLREKKAGNTTFIIMDKIRNVEGQMSKPFKAIPNAARLFDLVTVPKPELRTAFYFALRNTLVTQDLEQATKISFEGGTRRRVVTLQGELIDPSGTMSGGGHHAVSGSLGTSSSSTSDNQISDDRLQELERLIAKSMNEMTELQQNRRSLTLELDVITSELQTSNLALSKAKESLSAVLQMQKEIERQISDQKSALKNASRAKGKANSDFAAKKLKAEQDIDLARSDAESLEREVQEFEQKILDAGGQSLQDQVKAIQMINAEIEQLRKSCTEQEVNRDCGEKGIKSSDKAINKLEQDIAQAEADLKTSDASLLELEELAEQVVSNKESAVEAVQATEQQLRSLESTHQKMVKDYEVARSVQVEIKIQLEDCQRLYNENVKKAEAWSQKLNEISDQLQSNKGNPFMQTETDEFMTDDKESLQSQVAALEESLASMKPNVNAIDEYAAADGSYRNHLSEFERTSNSLNSARYSMEDLQRQRFESFMAGFRIITLKLKEMYQMLTLGGDAELELVDSLDPFSEGIVFSVRPPKKSWKNISNLSGGEKTLSSLALVFALHYYKPTPLYVMDEIDAALDFKNVSIVANYIRDRAQNGQFIIISLRNNMFELANRLVGIYKNDNASKTITIVFTVCMAFH